MFSNNLKITVKTNNPTVGFKGYITYRKVNKINNFIRFANQKFPNWDILFILDKRTGIKYKHNRNG